MINNNIISYYNSLLIEDNIVAKKFELQLH